MSYFTEAKFWARVDHSGGLDACWPWTAALIGKGYGRVDRLGHNVRAHRIAYELLVGPIPDGLFIIHSCDNPPCCNPAHLRAGTVLDNARDAQLRGRLSRGEHRPSAKLTEQGVRETRRLHATGVRQRAIARSFGVSPSTVNDVLQGRTWRHVA